MNPIKIGLIGGSGLGQLLGNQGGTQQHEIDTPFGRPSDAIIEAEWAGLPVFLLSRHGPGHVLNPSQVPYRANLFALKQLGVTHVIASGAVGSLREQIRPRDLVIADQVIDKTHRRIGTFYENAAVHVEMAEPFCPVLRQILIDAGKDLLEAQAQKEHAFTIHDHGCYVCTEGPAFSTRAESLMHRLWGGDLIGMTAMPEAKLAKEAEISYALVALATDYDCWRVPPTPSKQEGDKPALPHDPAVLLKEIIGNLQAASNNAITLIRKAVEMMAGRLEELAAAPAQQALQLAIWSDKARIAPEEVQRLGPLWMRYFGG